MAYYAGEFDVAIIGAGHAGCEAGLCCARLGLKTALFSMNLDAVANMPCNPSIGGTGKGHLVREIDALGGEMGKAADKTFIQSRVLNKGKGPAVYSLRVQSDRRAYQAYMKCVLEKQKNLYLIQAEITDIALEDGEVSSITTHIGAKYHVKAVIIATGTYLRSRIIVGDKTFDAGPDGQLAASTLAGSLNTLGISLMRFKTGTPVRVNCRSIDFSVLEEQQGDTDIIPFSFETKVPGKNKVNCHIVYTNDDTHSIIRANLNRSPLYSGVIEGIGPRYCPSIEDKVVRFADKQRHQLFVEPMGLDTQEMYIQGFSSSLPGDVQELMLHTLTGFEHAEIMRYAYAIEYDCADPTQLNPTMEFKSIRGLYGAGQFCGTSGYEEAAAQGLIAGINAALRVKGQPEFILDRSEAYIGTLIDDIVTKGTNEPYRIMTSRSEYRLLLRQDNADERLTPKGYEVGLISESRYKKFLKKMSLIEIEKKRLYSTIISPTPAVNDFLESQGTSAIQTGTRLSDLIRRPQITYVSLAAIDEGRPKLKKDIGQQVEVFYKYEGYIKRQLEQVERFHRLERRELAQDICYEDIIGLRLEARQKLSKIKPRSVGQAARISGVSPADISVLLIFLKQRGEKEK